MRWGCWLSVVSCDPSSGAGASQHAVPRPAGLGPLPHPRLPRGWTVRCATTLWEPMMLTAWHSYWPWSWRATPEILRVPDDKTRCRRSTDSWLPARRGGSVSPRDMGWGVALITVVKQNFEKMKRSQKLVLARLGPRVRKWLFEQQMPGTWLCGAALQAACSQVRDERRTLPVPTEVPKG